MVGAGVIGAGVAQLFAQTGHDVVLVDVREEPLESARRAIAKNLRMAALLQQEHLDLAAVLKRLKTALDITALAGADFVIENVTEDWELKRRVHATIASSRPCSDTAVCPARCCGAVSCWTC